jgi:RES domain.
LAILPLPPEDLRRFPRRRLRASVDLFRIHPAGLGPWWFSSDGHGRFDLTGPAGTCYLSLSPLGAFVEVFRDYTLVAAADVATRVVSRLRVRGDVVLADCTSARARGFGVTAAIHSTADYDTTQAWALTLRNHGYEGIRYFCGHDPSQNEIGVALFGDEGEAPWSVEETAPISEDVIQAVERRFKLHVLPAP